MKAEAKFGGIFPDRKKVGYPTVFTLPVGLFLSWLSSEVDENEYYHNILRSICYCSLRDSIFHSWQISFGRQKSDKGMSDRQNVNMHFFFLPN